MIIVRITMNSLMEKRTEVMQTLLSMIEPTENGQGCLSCHVLWDVEDRNVFSFVQEWETREDLDNHIKSDRFSVLLGTKSLLGEPQQIEIHTVSQSEGMDVIHAIRNKRS
jgi:quinol monooxygenase YgiN